MVERNIVPIFELSTTTRTKFKTMKITATQPTTNNQVIFTWSEDLTTCDYLAIGVPHEEVDDLLDRMMLCGAHEGSDYPGWEVKIN